MDHVETVGRESLYPRDKHVLLGAVQRHIMLIPLLEVSIV